MGTDNLFHKRRAARKSREQGSLEPKPNSYLIVAEGECTEPFYFNGLVDKIKSQKGGKLDVVAVLEVDCLGEGMSTTSLVNKTDEIVNKAKIIYQNIWVVFDKDDYDDFDSAIEIAVKKGYNVAWTNQNFEYWLFLHFEYSDSALHRDTWIDKLDDIFKKYELGEGKYKKNYNDIYQLVDRYDGVETAIKNAKRRMANYKEKDKPSKYDPGTTVHNLVIDLLKYLN